MKRLLRRKVKTDGSRGQTSAYTTINDLPNELVEKIVEDLNDNGSICRLSLTCKRFHFLVLPMFFTPNELEDLQKGSFHCHHPVPELLEAIRTALFVRHLSTITFHFTTGIEQVISDISSLCGLLARIPPVETILLGLPKHVRYSQGTSDTERWGKAFLKLLETIAKNGCRDLRLLDPLDLPPDSYNHLNVGTPSRPKSQGNKSRRTRNFGWFRAHPHTIGMSTLQIHSQRLFQPFFVGWIIDMLEVHRESLVCVHLNVTSIHPVYLLSHIYRSMNLPSVKEVKIYSRFLISRADLCSFLNRHPSINSLRLDGVLPSMDPQIPDPSIILPYLGQLTAMPLMVTLLLQHRNMVPLLSSVHVLLNGNHESEVDALVAVAPHTHISSLEFFSVPASHICLTLQRHIHEDKCTRIITSLAHIRTVILDKPVQPCEFLPRIAKRWLYLFPHLEHVSLCFRLLDARVGLSDKERHDVVIEFATQLAADRPTMKTLSVDSLPAINLDDLRSMPGFKA